MFVLVLKGLSDEGHSLILLLDLPYFHLLVVVSLIILPRTAHAFVV